MLIGGIVANACLTNYLEGKGSGYNFNPNSHLAVSPFTGQKKEKQES